MAKYEICPRCEGEGEIVNPVLSVWTASDIDEDPESFEAMREGRYNVRCTMCDGRRVVTSEDIDDYHHRQADAKVYAYESGDVESIMNGYWRL